MFKSRRRKNNEKTRITKLTVDSLFSEGENNKKFVFTDNRSKRSIQKDQVFFFL